MSAAVSFPTTTDSVPPISEVRDRLPTIPEDLSDYAMENTGPASWSAHPRAEQLAAWALESHDEPAYTRRTALLVDLLPTDVPRLLSRCPRAAATLSHRETFVLASIDGRSTIEQLLETIDVHAGEVLAILCTLWERGMIAIAASDSSVSR